MDAWRSVGSKDGIWQWILFLFFSSFVCKGVSRVVSPEAEQKQRTGLIGAFFSREWMWVQCMGMALSREKLETPPPDAKTDGRGKRDNTRPKTEKKIPCQNHFNSSWSHGERARDSWQSLEPALTERPLQQRISYWSIPSDQIWVSCIKMILHQLEALRGKAETLLHLSTAQNICTGTWHAVGISQDVAGVSRLRRISVVFQKNPLPFSSHHLVIIFISFIILHWSARLFQCVSRRIFLLGNTKQGHLSAPRLPSCYKIVEWGGRERGTVPWPGDERDVWSTHTAQRCSVLFTSCKCRVCGAGENKVWHFSETALGWPGRFSLSLCPFWNNNKDDSTLEQHQRNPHLHRKRAFPDISVKRKRGGGNKRYIGRIHTGRASSNQNFLIFFCLTRFEHKFAFLAAR